MDIEMMYNLQGQTAVIIGGARDLGYDMAEILSPALWPTIRIIKLSRLNA